MRLFVIHTTKQRKKNIDQQKSCFSPPTIIPKPNNYCKHPPHCSKALKDPRTMRNREFPFLHISFLGLSLALPGHSLLLNTESPDAPAHPLPIAISRYQPLKKHLPNNHWTIYYCYTNEKKNMKNVSSQFCGSLWKMFAWLLGKCSQMHLWGFSVRRTHYYYYYYNTLLVITYYSSSHGPVFQDILLLYLH